MDGGSGDSPGGEKNNDANQKGKRKFEEVQKKAAVSPGYNKHLSKNSSAMALDTALGTPQKFVNILEKLEEAKAKGEVNEPVAQVNPAAEINREEKKSKKNPRRLSLTMLEKTSENSADEDVVRKSEEWKPSSANEVVHSDDDDHGGHYGDEPPTVGNE